MGTPLLRQEVLKIFKELHRTRTRVFEGDALALEKARKKINSEFRRNLSIEDVNAIQEFISFAKEVEKELRISVVQAEELKPGHYQLKLRPETNRLDNVPFQDCPR